MNNRRLQFMLMQQPDLEVYVRIGEEVYKLSGVYVGQVLEDCGKLSPWHNGFTYQPGEKNLALFLDTEP